MSYPTRLGPTRLSPTRPTPTRLTQHATRRDALRVTLAASAAVALPAALAPSLAAAADAAVIERRVDLALNELYADVPGARELAGRSLGVLVMPKVVKGGFIVGGSYGEGALRLNPGDGLGTTVQYYSLGSASVGFQAGLQESSHALFFLSRNALEKFRRSDGWEAGADAEVTIISAGANLGIDSTVTQQPVVAFVFGQGGLLAGASIEGAKYTRIIR
ncbi:MAG: YSC84-related protein [Pseudomonadota bacterium]